jgi:multidrug efflux pump subunit AcrA (membrane-fusion protein)
MDMSMRGTAGDTPFPVTLVPAERRAATGSVTYTGTVAPFNEEDVFPRVTGRIVEMPVYPGDAVRPGQVLARLDDVELSSRVREAEAMRASALASRGQMEADVVSAQHGVAQMERELAMTDAEAGYAASVAARTERLYGVGAVSRQEWESDRAMAQAAQAKRDAARARLDQARAMEVAAGRKLDASAAMVAQGEAQVRTAQIVRDYVTIVAPSHGYVVKRVVAPGVLVQPGMPILKIAQVDRVRLQANVGERDLARIQVGSPVTVTPVGAGVAPFASRVTAVFPFVDPGARTAVVEAVVDNLGRRLLPGQYVSMSFVTGRNPQAVSVPRGAVTRLGGKAWVWVASDGRAERRDVVPGMDNAERIEITEGLAAGEQVIARPPDGLFAGARVRASGAGASAGDAAAGGGHAGHGAAPPRRAEQPAASGPSKERSHAGH